MTGSPLSLYFHIPFCEKKCDYCHFFVLPNQESLKERLEISLKREWDLVEPQLEGKKIPSLYFGGGTPALFGPERIETILSWARPYLDEDSEITLEANPENLDSSDLEAYRASGINRLSLGVQSFSNPLLEILSRQTEKRPIIDAIERAHSMGFDNLSIDLMIEVPNQTLQDVQESVQIACGLPISHLSIYNLTFEPGTVYYKKRSELEPLVGKEEVRREMFTWMCEYLKAAGFEQYEISAFCREGRRSIHNCGYWTGRPFLGLGPSAFSFTEKARYRNPANLSKYEASLSHGQLAYDFSERLDDDAHQREAFLIHLRLLEGVPKEKAPIQKEFREGLAEMIESGLIEETSQNYQLTPRGILLYDEVASHLV